MLNDNYPIYQYTPHPRHSELSESVPVKTRHFHHTSSRNVFSRFNARFGLKITLAVGTMWCAYAFSVLALFALPSAIHQGTYFVIVWLSSSFLQLVLLPIIIVGQNIQAAAADKRSEDTYKDAEAILKEAQELQQHLLAQDKVIVDIITNLRSFVPAAAPSTVSTAVPYVITFNTPSRVSGNTGATSATYQGITVTNNAAAPLSASAPTAPKPKKAATAKKTPAKNAPAKKTSAKKASAKKVAAPAITPTKTAAPKKKA